MSSATQFIAFSCRIAVSPCKGLRTCVVPMWKFQVKSINYLKKCKSKLTKMSAPSQILSNPSTLWDRGVIRGKRRYSHHSNNRLAMINFQLIEINNYHFFAKILVKFFCERIFEIQTSMGASIIYVLGGPEIFIRRRLKNLVPPLRPWKLNAVPPQ